MLATMPLKLRLESSQKDMAPYSSTSCSLKRHAVECIDRVSTDI
jgi:hypothetical protein